MRTFCDEDGVRWQAGLTSHGRTSSYLNPRVHRPIIQFTCLDGRRPRRYTGYPDEVPLVDQTDERLRILLRSASPH